MTGEVPLTPEQRQVIKAIYQAFQATGEWPEFITVDRPFRRAYHQDTALIIQSIPESFLIEPRPGSLRPTPNDRLRLTLSGILECDYDEETGDVGRFIDLLVWLAGLEESYDPEPGENSIGPRVTSTEIQDYLGMDADDSVGIKIIYSMLHTGNWGIVSSQETAEIWSITVGPNIWRFRQVRTLKDCISAQRKWWEEERTPVRKLVDMDFPQPVLFEAARSVPIDSGQAVGVQVQPGYVDSVILNDLKANIRGGNFDFSKLLALIGELNDNYERRNTYASHALLRTLLDHIPPVFGYANFAEVANNYPWSRTDKNYLKRLLQFKDQADDALHRSISSKTDLLDLGDMPPRIYVNRLLQEAIGKLLLF